MVTVVVTCLVEQNNYNAYFHKNLPKQREVFLYANKVINNSWL